MTAWWTVSPRGRAGERAGAGARLTTDAARACGSLAEKASLVERSAQQRCPAQRDQHAGAGCHTPPACRPDAAARAEAETPARPAPAYHVRPRHPVAAIERRAEALQRSPAKANDGWLRKILASTENVRQRIERTRWWTSRWTRS
jgi:hypothetical protein